MKAKFTFLARVGGNFVSVEIQKGSPIAPSGATSYYARFTENGVRQMKPLGKEIADALVAFRNLEIAREFEKRDMPVPVAMVAASKTITPNRVRIEDAIPKFVEELEQLGKARKTIHAYRNVVLQFCLSSRLELEYLDQIDRETVIKFIAHLRKTLTRHAGGDQNVTICNRLRYLRAFLMRHGMKIPLPERDWPRTMRKNPDRYSMEEINALLSVANREEKDLIQFFLYTGFRDEEVAHACYRDVDWKRGTINVKDKPEFGWKVKDHEQRPIDITLPPDFFARLKARREVAQDKNGLIFPNSKGRPTFHFLNTIKDLAAKAGLEKNATLHKFRRTFGTMYAKQFSLRVAQAALGHSKLETTARYLSADEMDTPEARKQVTEMWAAVGD